MANLFGKMLEHPIASVLVIGTAGSAIAEVIRAAKKK